MSGMWGLGMRVGERNLAEIVGFDGGADAAAAWGRREGEDETNGR